MIFGNGTARAEKRFKSLAKSLCENLKEAIHSGQIAPGQRLDATALAESLKVGPVALRDALRRLEAEGYVTFRRDNDIIVSKPSREEIEDCYAIAAVLEGLAARLAVERAQPEDLQHLTELHQALKETARKRDQLRFFDAQNEFHRFIADVARNQRLFRLIEQLRRDIQKTRILTLHGSQRLDYSMHEHDQILDGFVKKNPTLAESAMINHLNNQIRALRKSLSGTKGASR